MGIVSHGDGLLLHGHGLPLLPHHLAKQHIACRLDGLSPFSYQGIPNNLGTHVSMFSFS